MADKKSEPGFSTQTVTNVSKGPRVLNSRIGHLLQPGQSVEDVEISDAEMEVAKAHRHLEFGAKAAKAAESKEPADEEK